MAEMLLLFLCVNVLRPNLFCSRCLATVGGGGKELVGLSCTGSTQQCLSVCPAPPGCSVPGCVCPQAAGAVYEQNLISRADFEA